MACVRFLQGPESVTIRQLTAATQGTRGQWHIATEHARTSASGPHPPPPSSCVLHPDLTLTPGEPATLQLVMQPPPPTTQPAIQGTATHTSNTASEGQGQPPLLPCFDDSGCVPRGLLDHWYGRDLGGGASATRSRAGSDTTLATRTQRTGGASTGPGHCDPPVGLAVLWRSRGSGAVSHSGGISTSGISTSGVGGAGQERVGVVWLTDLTRSALPPNQPLRSRLRLQQASQTGVILHDFRSAAMCVVDLVLGVRNCLGKPVNVELQVRVCVCMRVVCVRVHVQSHASRHRARHCAWHERNWAMCVCVSHAGWRGCVGECSSTRVVHGSSRSPHSTPRQCTWHTVQGRGHTDTAHSQCVVMSGRPTTQCRLYMVWKVRFAGYACPCMPQSCTCRLQISVQ